MNQNDLSETEKNCSQNDETLPRVIRKQKKISPKHSREEPCRQMCVIRTITI